MEVTITVYICVAFFYFSNISAGKSKNYEWLRETAGGIHISVHSELWIMAIHQIFLWSKSTQSFDSSYGRVQILTGINRHDKLHGPLRARFDIKLRARAKVLGYI